MERPIKFLLSRDDLTHQRGYWIIATALREAGIEVVLGGVQIPQEIAETAIQEDVDIIGYRIMQGSPRVLVPSLFEEMRQRAMDDVEVVVGGIVSEKDEALLKELGVKEVFHPLTPLQQIVDRIKGIGGSAPSKKGSED